MPPRPIWRSSSPSSIRTTANRWPPSVTSPRWPSPCSGVSIRGTIDDADAVRAVATRRLAGMGVDTEAAADWLANYSSDWVFASDADGRRLAVLEDQGIHAEVAFPGPVLAGGLSPAMYLGSQTSKGLEPVWPAIHAYNRWLAEFCAAAPGRRAACIPIDLHDMDRAVEEIAWVRSSGIFGGVMLPAMSIRSGPARLRRRVLRAALERLRGPRHGRQPAHRGLGHGHRQQVPLRRQARRLPRAVRGVRVHPAPALVHDLRRGVRPPPEAQGGGHGERGPVAALARPRHGVVLRHPWRGAGALLSQAATVGVLRAARLPRRVAHEAPRGRDARRDRHRPADVGGRLPPPGGGGARPPARSCARCSAGCRRRTSAGCSV